jgi:hypothetical protein
MVHFRSSASLGMRGRLRARQKENLSLVRGHDVVLTTPRSPSWCSPTGRQQAMDDALMG